MKIFDCFMFYNELDILEIRFKELYDAVDYFVIVEATTTHTGKPKPLFYLENKERFAKYNDKVIHYITNFKEDYSFAKYIHQKTDAWFKENYQRECIQIPLKFKAEENDIILLTDADEIPKRDFIEFIRDSGDRLEPNSSYSMEMTLYYYTIEYTTKRLWPLAKIFKYSLMKHRHLLSDIRGEASPKIANAGFHLSYFGDVNFIKTKVESFAESEEYQSEKKSVEWLKSCYEAGVLHFNNEKLIHIPLDSNDNVPLFYKK